MKRIVSLILAVTVCLTICGNSAANASNGMVETTRPEETVSMDIVDGAGNIIGTVDIPAPAVASITIGAIVFIAGVKAAIFNGTVWVSQNPQLAADILTAAITIFESVNAYFGGVREVNTNSTATQPVSAVKIDGNQCQYYKPTGIWNCMYSL